MPVAVQLASPAETIDWDQKWLVSCKIDGIRAYLEKKSSRTHLTSRNGKPIPNRFIANTLESIPELAYYDGELITFTNGVMGVVMDDFNTVQSKVMTAGGRPDFVYYIFDNFQYPDKPFTERMANAPYGISPQVKIIVQHPVASQEALDHIEKEALKAGWEGLMIRRADGRYKFGRSTAREGLLLKVVRKNRAEAVITGGYERMHNANEATRNELGYIERSSHKENLVGRGDLGGFEVHWDGIADGKQMADPIDFSVGTGFDDEQRQFYWNKLSSLIGQRIVFEFRGVGSKGRPRFPAFIAHLIE